MHKGGSVCEVLELDLINLLSNFRTSLPGFFMVYVHFCNNASYNLPKKIFSKESVKKLSVRNKNTKQIYAKQDFTIQKI